MHPTQVAYAAAKAIHDTVKQRAADEKAQLVRPSNSSDAKEWEQHWEKEFAIDEKHGVWAAHDKMHEAGRAMINAAKEKLMQHPRYKQTSDAEKKSISNLYANYHKNPTIRDKMLDAAFKLRHDEPTHASAKPTSDEILSRIQAASKKF